MSLVDRFDSVRGLTERMAEPLSPEDQTVQSMPDCSPTKWHRAHVTWFFEAFVLAEVEDGFEPFGEGLWYLFNSYYEAVGPRYPRPQRGLVSRPGAAEVGAYRANVDRRVRSVIETLDEGRLAKIAPLVVLGLHHEQQHQELLLMDIKHALSLNPLRPAYLEGVASSGGGDGAGAEAGCVDFDGGLVEVGLDVGPDVGPEVGNHGGATFAFDNEGPRHRVWLEPFRLADRLVTAGEWLAFMADGGYRRPELWLSDGWATVGAERWEAPLYWTEEPGAPTGWSVHTLGGTRPVDVDEPVSHVSFYEADAFANWAGARLPTEAEWEHAALSAGGDPASGNVLDLAVLGPLAAPPAGGLRQLWGDCWEWTASAYRPYPGFRPAPGAVGEYNGKFMSNQMVLRGGSAYTPPGHIRATYRNFFPPAARWPLTGVRLAAGDDTGVRR